MGENGWTPGPWEYVPGNEHHGPYVTTNFGSTVCDCYAMSNPASLSVRNGGDSKPYSFLAEMAEPNARLIAASPALAEALEAFNLTESMVVGGTADTLTLRVPIATIQKAAAALALAKGRTA